MEKNRIAVCFSSDNNYAQHLCVAMASILRNKNKEDELIFYVIDGGLSSQSKENIKSLRIINDFEINFLEINKELFEIFPLSDKSYISLATYYRLILPDIIPNENKLIYLDCDLIVTSSLNDLIKFDIENFCLGGVECVTEAIDKENLNTEKYINAGVLLINAQKWRKEGITATLFEWARENPKKIKFYDQDIINGCLNKKIKYIDRKWNIQTCNFGCSEDFNNYGKKSNNIIHFISKRKPWNTLFSSPFEKVYFENLKCTPYKKFIFKYLFAICPVTIIKNIFLFIFEVKNSDDKKIKYITFLGIKLKIKRHINNQNHKECLNIN